MASSSLFTQSFYSIMTTGMRSVSFWGLAAVVLILSGCAGSGQTAHPLAGNWDYVVETPDGNYEGTFTFTDGEEGLMGSIIGDGFSESLPLAGITFAESMLDFEFDTPDFGRMSVSVQVDEDSFSGNLNVVSYGMEAPISGMRAASEDE